MPRIPIPRFKRPLARLLPGRPRRGAILSLVMIFSIILLGLAAGLTTLAVQQTRQRARYEVFKDEFGACELGLNKAFGETQFLINYGSANFDAKMAAIQPPSLEGYDFPQFDVTKLSAGNESITSGRWAGLTLYQMKYRIDATARKIGGTAERFDHGGVALSQNLEITYVPLYLYAIFYDPNMEIAPGAPMVVNGLVHSNGNAYIQSNSGLTFQKNVTVAGHVYHGRYWDAGQSTSYGSVQFTKNGTQVSMARSTGDANSDGWLSSADADWASAATSRFGDGLRDQAHGISPLSLPIPTTVDPHAIIEPTAADDSYSLQQEKFQNKAGLVITQAADGTISAVNSAGTPVALTYPDPNDATKTKSIVSTKTFYDAREGKTVSSIDVNLGNMVESGIKPANGILYVNTNGGTSTNPGVVRLTNGAQLPASTSAGGFTVTTRDPLYIKGNYNTVNKTLAMVASDALTILSNNWNDANSTNYSSRNANATTVNTVCMTGTVPSSGGHYSGGVENYFRFLENWAGVNYNFSGSIINMWDSQRATQPWGKSNVYSPPNRNWSWDTGLGGINGPPGAPRVVQLTKTTWEMQDAGS